MHSPQAPLQGSRASLKAPSLPMNTATGRMSPAPAMDSKSIAGSLDLAPSKVKIQSSWVPV
jgi:hypothetical protein